MPQVWGMQRVFGARTEPVYGETFGYLREGEVMSTFDLVYAFVAVTFLGYFLGAIGEENFWMDEKHGLFWFLVERQAPDAGKEKRYEAESLSSIEED